MNLDTLEKLFNASTPAPIRLDATRCLNLKHKARACAECHACPTNAIQFNDAAPTTLDETKCVACGLCVSMCPSGTFIAHPGDNALLDAVSAHAHIEFACKRASVTRAPNIERVMTVACIARLSHDTLVALGAEHARVWLNDAPCAECPIGERTHPHIVNLVESARATLATWARAHTLTQYGEAENELGESRTLAAANTPALSRRELFGFLRGNLGRAAGMVVAASLSATPLASSTPNDTPTFERALTKLGAPSSGDLVGQRVATIRVSDACTACGLCAKQCPTHAIEFRTDPGYYVLDFHAHHCLGTRCHLCELYCQPQALALEPGMAFSVYQAREPIHLSTGKLGLCTKCQTPFALHENETQCPTCRSVQHNLSALAREAFKNRNLGV